MLCFQIGGIQNHRPARRQQPLRKLMQTPIGAFVHGGVVQLFRFIRPLGGGKAGQPLALPVRADHHRAQAFRQLSSVMAFAAAGDALHDNEKRSRWARIALCQRHIGLNLRQQLRLVVSRQLLGAQRGDLGPDQRTIRLIETQQRQRGIVPGGIEPGLQNQAADTPRIPMIQVHQQKAQIRDGIDPAELFIELNAVKRRQHAFNQGDVVQMQIPMAGPHMALIAAAGQ